ncbi:uncharacterized mitochondrial protein AtMg00810-like, partial [Telopea speciosissima]|uniref:uncharacterized mitochondrial protein AtMg00810-like n=1 Tax=Telopea speciosissima TaxID=54955 RepID=UPI001CC42D9A
MLGCKPAETPLEPNIHLKSKEGNPVDKGNYRRLVGRLIYLSHTRPDIAFAVSLVSQYMHDPHSSHLEASCRISRRSTSGYYTFVGENLVTWRSKKQSVVARSSAEVEFRAMAHGV